MSSDDKEITIITFIVVFITFFTFLCIIPAALLERLFKYLNSKYLLWTIKPRYLL